MNELRQNNPNSLSRHERLFLYNQYKILEALYPGEAEYYSVKREALEYGYEIEYDLDTMEFISKEVMTREESIEVWDTFDMFDSFKISAEKGKFTDWLSKQHPSSFAGYDGNNETKFWLFARFTIQRLKRFEYLELSKQPDPFNSPIRMRDTYKRMLDKWKPLGFSKWQSLTQEDIKLILLKD
ncbi:MAG: YfbU family protein [Paracoccaceae bacterium]|nr:YfbU family protein [Paracoccaceae bacterium]MDE2674816.1 YfbU family protein [Paracoccaceae bacterium]